MIFRQLFDRSSCTYTYLLACSKTGEAVLIDPVREHVARDSAMIEELGLRLVWTLETHVHADHVTSSGLLRDALAARSVVSASGGAPCADRLVHHGELVRFGDEELEVRATPGHTHGCVAYVHHGEGMAFTGDTLLIRGCGRTDFQQGDARQLYHSVHTHLFSLPDSVFIYPGHDYLGRTRSTVAEEKAHNPRLGGGRSVEAFVEIMANLKLPSPAQIDVAVPANQQCGWLAGDPPRAAQGGPWAPILVQDGVPEVHIDWVRAQTGHRMIDVREPDEWRGPLGRVAGSELSPLGGLASAAVAWDRDAPVILICRSGGRSGRAAKTLISMGFTKVVSMAGGMLAWEAAGLPAERD